MLSCNEGDAGLAAEVREKMPHSRPVLNTFEHFVLGFHRELRPVGLCLRVVSRSRFGASSRAVCDSGRSPAAAFARSLVF